MWVEFRAFYRALQFLVFKFGMNSDALDKTIDEALSGKKILLTGATGFLGQTLLIDLLNKKIRFDKIFLIIRASRDKSALERLKELKSQLLKKLHDRSFEIESLLDRLYLLEVDLKNTQEVIDKLSSHEQARGLDLIVHCAANLKFHEPIERAFLDNAASTFLLSELLNCDGFEKCKLLLVSSAYVTGRRDGKVREELNQRDFEVDIFRQSKDLNWCLKKSSEHVNRYPNHYLWSKSVAEQILTALNKPDRFLIYRPSIIQKFGANSSMELYGLAHRAQYFVAKPQVRMDIVSVDFVAQHLWLCAARLLSGTELTSRNNIIHACRGWKDSLPFANFLQQAAQFASQTNSAPFKIIGSFEYYVRNLLAVCLRPFALFSSKIYKYLERWKFTQNFYRNFKAFVCDYQFDFVNDNLEALREAASMSAGSTRLTDQTSLQSSNTLIK